MPFGLSSGVSFEGCAFRCRARRNRSSPPTASVTTAAATPIPIPTPAPVLRPLPVLDELLLDAEADDVEELALEEAGLGVHVDVGAAVSEGAMDVVGAVGLLEDQVCGAAFDASWMAKGGELEDKAALS